MNKTIKSIDAFLNRLVKNQNNTSISEFKNIYSNKDYFVLLSDVTLLLADFPDENLEFYKKIIFESSKIKSTLLSFVMGQKMTPSMVVKYGSKNINDTLYIGKSDEINDIDVTKDTLYDLASTSKMFTAVAVLKLCEYGLINLEDDITKYEPRFIGLKGITILDLLSFRVPVKTKERIDAQKSVADAQNVLFTLEKDENHDPSFLYTDMGCLALKYVVENVSQMTFDEFLNEEIFNKFGMTHTCLNPTNAYDIASENYGMKVNQNGIITLDKNILAGTVHDPKTIALGHKIGNAPGHAGYFSNADDMFSFAQNLAQENIINRESLDLLTTPLVGNDNAYYFGLLNYYKQRNKNYIKVQDFLSGKSSLSPGFSGTCLCVDTLNNIYGFIGANRLHNRIYQLPQRYRNDIVPIYDARMYQGKFVNFDYTIKCCDVMKKIMELSLKYAFLEYLFKPKKEIKLVKKI